MFEPNFKIPGPVSWEIFYEKGLNTHKQNINIVTENTKAIYLL